MRAAAPVAVRRTGSALDVARAVLVAALTAAVVVGLGLLADAVAERRAGAQGASPDRVTVEETVTREAPLLNQ